MKEIQESSPQKSLPNLNEKKSNDQDLELARVELDIAKDLLQEERQKNLDLENQFLTQKSRNNI